MFSLCYKIKSAPTEVGAPKNANSDCRYTNRTELEHNTSNNYFRRNLRFYQIHNTKIVIAKKGYSIPKQKIPQFYLFSLCSIIIITQTDKKSRGILNFVKYAEICSYFRRCPYIYLCYILFGYFISSVLNLSIFQECFFRVISPLFEISTLFGATRSVSLSLMALRSSQ